LLQFVELNAENKPISKINTKSNNYFSDGISPLTGWPEMIGGRLD
jgi:hypothetical protein